MLTTILTSIGSFVLSWIEHFKQADIMIDWGMLALLFFLLSVWLGCACWASTIAESRRHGPRLHFFIGLVLPFVYPPVALLSLNVKRPKRAKTAAAEKAAQSEASSEAPPAEDFSGAARAVAQEKAPGKRRRPAEPPVPPEEPAQEKKEEAPDSATQFQQLADDLKQNPGNRCRITYSGGRQVVVTHVYEVAEQHAAVGIETASGETQRIRIPYARLEAIEPIAEDTEE